MSTETKAYIAFVGFAPTVGDTAIGQSILQGLRRYVGLPIHIYTNRADVFSKLPGMGANDKVFDRFPPRIAVEEDKIVELSRYHYTLLNDLRTTGGRTCLKLELFKQLEEFFDNCAGLVFQGGPHWNSKWTNYKRTVQRRYLLEAAKFYDVPVFHVGVSCGPFKWKFPTQLWMRSLFAKTLALHEELIVRDSFSKPYLNQMGVSDNVVESTDAAVFLEAYRDQTFDNVENQISQETGRPKVVVCLRDFQPRYSTAYEHRDRVYREMALLLDEIAEHDADVYFLGTDHNHLDEKITDADVAREVLGKMTSNRAKLVDADVWNPSALKFIYGRFDAMITMRLHPAILALGCNVPTMMISYDRKCDDFFGSLGLRKLLLDIVRFDSERALPLAKELLRNQKFKEDIHQSFRELRMKHADDYTHMYASIRKRAMESQLGGGNAAVPIRVDDRKSKSSHRRNATPHMTIAMLAVGTVAKTAKRFATYPKRTSQDIFTGIGETARNLLPPRWSGYKTIRHLAIEEFSESTSIIHPQKYFANHLPINIHDRNQLPKDRGWWGYSFYDVPKRCSSQTFLSNVQNCRIVSYRDPAKNEDFYPAILNSSDDSLDSREIRFRERHAFRLLNSGKSQVHLDHSTWITERVYHNHSHWLTSHLPKLLLLQQRDELGDVILPSKRTKVIDHSLEMIGLDPTSFLQYDEERILKVNHLRVLATDRFRPELLQLVPKAFGVLNDPTGTRKVFISRRAAARRRLLNEDDVWDLLQGFGFERVSMEHLSFQDQVQLMAETRILCAPHGAGLTNMMFCPPGADILEIADLSFPNPNFYALASALDHRYWLLRGEGVGDCHPLNKDLVADVDHLKTALSQMDG